MSTPDITTSPSTGMKRELGRYASSRDVSLAQPRLYVIVMIAIGLIYVAYLLLTRGRHGLTMPDLVDVDRELDAEPTEASSPEARR